MKPVVPSLETDDVHATIRFYQDVLDFEVISILPNEIEPGWVLLRNGQAELVFSERNTHSSHVQVYFTGSFYFEPTNLNEVWEKVQTKGAQIAWPLETFDYGIKEFGMYDNNGYLLRFGCEV
ncbi:MAG: VOC family protein [Spirosomataceae bacterium]